MHKKQVVTTSKVEEESVVNNEDATCTLCHSKNALLFHDHLRYDYPAKIYKCKACEFVFLHPRLTDLELETYYKGKYREDYGDVSVEARFDHDLEEAQVRLTRLDKSFDKESSLLEIGSGSGAFLSLASKHFNDVAGVELDANARNFLNAKSLDIFSDLQELEGKKFDLIVLFHVFEHLPDPSGFLKELTNYLNEDGFFVIEVPSVDDSIVSYYNLKEFKDFYFCSAHLSYFSSRTLNECAQSAGLKGEVSQLQRYDLYNHLHWLKSRRPGTLPENQQLLSEETLRSYKNDLISNEMGDTLWGVFQKTK